MRPKEIDIDLSDFPELKYSNFPSFKEFCKNPDKWRGKKDGLLFGAVDKGTNTLRHLIVKQDFELFGYNCDNLEKVEQIAKDHGYTIDQLDAKPQIIPVEGGRGSQKKCNIHVVFVPKWKNQIWTPK